MDPDFTTVALWPDNLAWERTWSAFFDALVAGGWDPRHGARLSTDLRAAGLVNVQAEYVRRSVAGGSLQARLLSLSLERLRGRMVALGAASEEIDEARDLLEDPASTLSSPTMCVASARRAASRDARRHRSLTCGSPGEPAAPRSQ